MGKFRKRIFPTELRRHPMKIVKFIGLKAHHTSGSLVMLSLKSMSSKCILRIIKKELRYANLISDHASKLLWVENYGRKRDLDLLTAVYDEAMVKKSNKKSRNAIKAI